MTENNSADKQNGEKGDSVEREAPDQEPVEQKLFQTKDALEYAKYCYDMEEKREKSLIATANQILLIASIVITGALMALDTFHEYFQISVCLHHKIKCFFLCMFICMLLALGSYTGKFLGPIMLYIVGIFFRVLLFLWGHYNSSKLVRVIIDFVRLIIDFVTLHQTYYQRMLDKMIIDVEMLNFAVDTMKEKGENKAGVINITKYVEEVKLKLIERDKARRDKVVIEKVEELRRIRDILSQYTYGLPSEYQGDEVWTVRLMKNQRKMFYSNKVRYFFLLLSYISIVVGLCYVLTLFSFFPDSTETVNRLFVYPTYPVYLDMGI